MYGFGRPFYLKISEMNPNSRSVAPTNVPRALRPKTVNVSPIKSPFGSPVQQAVIPVITSGQSQYMFGGNVMPQVYQGVSVSQAVPGSQSAVTAQPLYPQSQTLSGTRPRMAVFPQSLAVPQNVSEPQLRISTPTVYPPVGTSSQAIPGSQQRFGTRALYPHIGTVTQNLSTPQSQISGQVLYPQPVQISNQMPIQQNNVPIIGGVPVVQNSVPVPQSRIPIVQNNSAVIVSTAPVFQTVSFQPNRQISYQTQISPQIQTGQPFTFQGQIASNVMTPVFSPAVTNITSTFQPNYAMSNCVNLNPAYITSQNQGVMGKVPDQPQAQQNVTSTGVVQDTQQHLGQSQFGSTGKQTPEIRIRVSSIEESQNQLQDGSEQNVGDSLSPDNTLKVFVKPATIIVKPATAEQNQESSSEPEECGDLSRTESSPGGMQQVAVEGDSEIAPVNSLMCSAHLGSSEEKKFPTESTFFSSKQESIMEDNISMELDMQDSSPSQMSSVATGEFEEFLSLPPAFDTESTLATENSVDSLNSEMIEEPATVGKGLSQENKQQQSYMSMDISAVEPSVDQVSSENVDGNTEDSITNIAEIDELSNDNSHLDTDTVEAVSELRDSDSVHSSVEAETKTGGDIFCQVCSSDNSQDGAMSSDVLDLYTDESNSITWENFHETVLNLRANKDKGRNMIVDTAGENSSDSKTFDCDKDSAGITLEENGDNFESKTKEDGSHEQSFEGEEEEPEFVWEDYLQQTGTTAVPATAFKHVEFSLQSGFVKGMKLEVPNKSDPSTYWVATVLMTCGPLLRLRYDGYGDEISGDFWCDLNTTEIHPIGWSAQNEKSLQPPNEIRDRVSDWRSFLLESLTGARTAPACFFEKGAALSPIDQLKCGMKLELQDALNPQHVWLVQILENVGGRLYLRLDGTQSASQHFWLFYLNHRLHPIGWANEQEGCIYRPPKDIYDEQTDESWAEILQTALKECEGDLVPEEVFKDQQELKPHQFAVGMKLEALIPGMNMIGPATVTKVINNLYFIVEIDDLRSPEQRESVQICCNSEYLGIFPVSWCQCKGIRLSPPQGWQGGDFVWGEYLSFCNARAAPEKLFHSGTDDHDFERGMKLEAVNPNNHNQICAATITKIVGPLLWIHLDHMRDIPSHIEDIDSHNLFPVGWCESNNYQLKPPVKAKPRPKHLSECKTEEVYRSVTSSQTKGAWCPKIFLNHRCFSGPYLSKGRISDLPKYVGPGPMDLVLKEVLSLLISIAYVPCRALKEIQQEGPLNPNMKTHTLKAKYKGKKYKAVVEVCQNESQLEEFCRNTCIKLECCPYLFSPLHVRNSCPENCQHLTKTKSNPNYVKKRKPSNIIGVKPIVSQDGSYEPKKRGRKRKHFLYTHKKGQGHRPQDPAGDMKDEGFIDDYDDDGLISAERKAYDIQTRGAKLPKYSFERKSHRKILMTPTMTHVNKHKQGYKRLLPKPWPVDEKPERLLVPREGSLKLESNPLHWTVADVIQFLKSTDCSHLARIMKEQEVDGQAFLLLNLSAIQEHLELKLGPAVKLCHQIERLKLAFYENYA